MPADHLITNVNRFKMFLVTNELTKVSNMLENFLSYFEKHYFCNFLGHFLFLHLVTLLTTTMVKVITMTIYILLCWHIKMELFYFLL